MTAAASSPAPIAAGSLLQLTLSLALVVALIFAVSYLLKRLRLNTARTSRSMEVLDQLSLGPRERVVLMRVGEAQVLLGVSAGGVVSLTPLGVPLQLPPATANDSFAARLRDYLRDGAAP